MSVSSPWFLPLLAFGAIVAGVVLANKRRIGVQNIFDDRQLLQKGLDLPTIWLYYDDSDVNTRFWADFGARSSRVLNVPYLNLCYETILKYNGEKYKIEVIGGLDGVAERLGGYDALPGTLKNPKASVNEAELNWIRAAILAKFGGLWLTPSVICLRPFGELPADKTIFFGTDLDETRCGPNGTAVPGLRAIWAGSSGNPIFVQWATTAHKRLNEMGGGLQIRGDQKSDFTQFASGKSVVIAGAELARKGNDGRRIQLDDLLAKIDDLPLLGLLAGGGGRSRAAVFSSSSLKDAIYVPIPWTELRDRRIFGWFLRMSEEQILTSDLTISYLFIYALT